MAITCKPSGWIPSVAWALRAQMKLQRQIGCGEALSEELIHWLPA